MSDKYDKKAVAERMAKESKLRRLAQDPVIAHSFKSLFASNNLRPEEGKSEFETFVDFFKERGEGSANAKRGKLTDPKWTQQRIAEEIAKRFKGLGDAQQVARIIGAIREHATSDALLERNLKRDYADRPEIVSDSKDKQESKRAFESRREAVKDALYAAPKQPEKKAAASTGKAPTIRQALSDAAGIERAPEPGPAPSIREALSNAMSASPGEETNDV